MDGIEIELVAERLEIKYEYLMVSSLLLVDDISMVNGQHKHTTVKEMLTVVEFVCNKQHMAKNYEKREVLEVENKIHITSEPAVKVGGKTYEIKNKIKYLETSSHTHQQTNSDTPTLARKFKEQLRAV